jgi:hypothetical protein
MEEAPVEEQNVVLGGDEAASAPVEADEYNAISYEGSVLDSLEDPNFELPTNSGDLNTSTYLEVGEDLTIGAAIGHYFISAVSKNERVISNDNIVWDDETLVISAGERTGKARIDVKMGMEGSSVTKSYVINIVVYDGLTPAAVEVWEELGNKMSGTITRDMYLSSITVVGYAIPIDGDFDCDIKWTSDKTKVAEPVYTLTPNGGFNVIKLKGKGTATITASIGSVKTTFKIKVTDEYAPKSVTIKATDTKVDCYNVYDGTLNEIGVTSVVTPGPLNDPNVEYTLENTKYFKFVNWATGATSDSKTAKLSNNLVDAEGRAILRTTGSHGTVKLTVKTYNGKKNSIKLTAKEVGPSKIDMWGFYKNETYTTERYSEEETTDPEDPKNNKFVVVPRVYYKVDGSDVEVDSETLLGAYELASVKWSSSNKKVATIGIFKDFTGYFTDEDAWYDFYGREVYEDQLAYAALVEIKGTGTTTLTAKTRDGKQSFSIKLKVDDNHKVTDIILTDGKTVTVPVGEVIDLNEYFIVYPSDYYGKVTAKPSHSTSKVAVLDGTVIETIKTGDVTIKVKAGDKSQTFTLKIK